MKIVKFNKDKHYDEVTNWWKEHSFPTIPSHLLSDTGFIVADDNDVNQVAIWVYKTNSPIYIFEWLIGNPAVDKNIRNQGIDFLLDFCLRWSKDNGAESMIAMVKEKHVVDRFKKHQFNSIKNDMITLVRSL